MELSDLLIDGLLKEFRDRCRAGDRDMAIAALHELRMRVYNGAPLPRDPRDTAEDREARAEVGRQWTKRLLAASVALAQCRDALALSLGHHDYCDWGDKWERECAKECKLEETIRTAIGTADALLK
jgi:hypothetical protein